MKDFKKLKVWEKAHRLTLNVYEASAKLPREELYGITSQMRRACLSVPTNIAKVVVEVVTRILLVFCRSLWVLQAKSNTFFSSVLT